MSSSIAHRFSVVDYVLFIGSLVISFLIGLYYVFFKKQDTNTEFLMAGRSMGIFPVAMSLLASFISAITILAIPAEVFYNGLQFFSGGTVGLCIAVTIVGTVLMPILYHLKVLSIYEYLEIRFGSRFIRQMATVTFMLKMQMYMAVVLYTPALALSAVTPLPIWASILTVGGICSVYTGFGGLRAVLWTDVFQIFIMIAGLMAIVIQGCIEVGGVSEVWRIASEQGRTTMFDFSVDPFLRQNFWILIFGATLGWLSTYGCSQTSAQRYICMKSYRGAQWALFSNIPMIIGINVFAYGSGLVAFAVYSKCDPLTSGQIEKRDQVMPYLVMDKLSSLTGIPGLFVACTFSASLSTLSSGLNAMASVTWEDFLQHNFMGRYLIKHDLSLAANKTIALLYGALSVGLAFGVGNIGTIIDALITVSGSITGPLLAAFLLAAFVPWCNRQGATIGMLVGYAVCIWLAVGSLVTQKRPISKPLPISIDECPAELNATLKEDNTPLSPLYKDNFEFEDIYRISFMLYTLLGTIISMGIAIPVSYFTGNHPVDTLDPLLVSPVVRRYVGKNFKGDSKEEVKEKEDVKKPNGKTPEELELPSYVNVAYECTNEKGRR